MDFFKVVEIVQGQKIMKALETVLLRTKTCFYCKQNGHWLEDCGNLATLKKYCSKEKSAKTFFEHWYGNLKAGTLVGEVAVEGLARKSADNEVLKEIDDILDADMKDQYNEMVHSGKSQPSQDAANVLTIDLIR